MFSLIDPDETMGVTSPLQTIGRFEVISRLGAGGFGTVWKARDRELDRIVAVKVPRKGQLGPADAEQFFREARAAAQLRHAHIVPVHEVGRDGETLFIVSDFVFGVDLSTWLSGKRASPWEVAELCGSVADALHHAHQKGVVHRDLKPSNIMIDESGEPHLMDFGLAKREVGEITMTVDGQVLGTPAYMSPEQAGGQSHWTDRRTDIYSLGVMMFEMLTGELPFRGNPQMQMYQRLREDPPDPRTLNRHLPRDLATICFKCIEREPGRRYSTAAELRDELRRFINGEPIQARPISAPGRLARWAKRKPWMAAVAGLIIFLAIAGPAAALVFTFQKHRLVALNAEKDDLIKRNATEKLNDTNRITQLAQQLALWEGRANPWQFWPPKKQSPPRQELLASLLEHSAKTVDGKLQNGSYSPEQLASGYFGLAILADAKGDSAHAIAYYEKAHEQLTTLHEQEPSNSKVTVALAECSLSLSRLLADQDRAAAEKHLASATAAMQQLAAEHPGEPTYQSVWLEAELASATMAGFDSAAAHLQRVSAIRQSLDSRWPTEPGEVYRVACFLAQRAPILLEGNAAEAP
jgi:serine/threonine protein kinase